MIDVYAIGTTLKLNDLVTPHLLRLSEQFAKVDALALQVNKRLKSMSAEVVGVRNLAAAAGKLDLGLKGVKDQSLLAEKALHGIKGALPSGLGIEAEMVAANAQVNILGRQLHALRNSGKGMVPTLPVPGGGGGGGGGRRGGGGHLHGGNMHVGPHGVGIGGVGMGLASDLMVPLAAGMAAVYVGHKFYESAKELEKAKADLANLNLSKADNDSVLAKSWSLTNSVHGTTAAENLALIQDLHTATGDLKHSLEMSDAYAKFSVAASLQNNGQAVEGLVGDSIKALEHRGDKVLQDPVERDRELRMQSKVDFFTRGKVSPSDYFAMSKTGKLAYQLASPEYLYGPAAALISANSGSTAGTMEMTALSSLIGGHMDKKGKAFLADLGLWSDVVDPKVKSMRNRFEKDPEYQKIVAANGGSLIQSGGLTGANAELFVKDHNKFVLGVLVPAIQKKYGLNISDEDIARLLSANLNRSTSNDLAFWVTNRQKVAKDTSLIGTSKDYEGAYSNYMDHTPSGAERDFDSAWTNFKTEFGETMLPAITEMLKTGASILRTINGIQTTSMTVAKAQTDQVPQADHKTVGPWGKLGDFLGWNGEPSPSSSASASTAVQTTVAAAKLGSGLYLGSPDASMGFTLPPASTASPAGSPGNAAWTAEAVHASPKGEQSAADKKAFIASLSDMLAAKLGGVTDSLTSKINGAKVVMDGATVGNLILDHMSREASRPSTGTSSFDTHLGPLRPDYGF